jgi:hypothetical protein
VLTRIFGSERERSTGGWRKLLNEGRRDLSSPNNIRLNRSRGMRWAELATRVGDIRNEYKVFLGKTEV